jgi:predicted metalloprotease
MMSKRPVLHVVVAVATVAALAVPSWATAAGAAQVRASAPSADATLKAAIADIQSYWTKEFPQLYGGSYTPLGQIVAAGPGTKIPDCQGKKISYAKQVKGNAFYCFQSNFITYDNQGLFPALVKNFGPFATALVLAHEWGHAIQDRAGFNRDNQAPIFVELQADCFAGSWVQRIANGDSKTVKFAPGDLDRALSAYFKFRDPPGNAPDDPQAHGDAFDRVNAFQTGFEKGAPACKPFFDTPPPVTEQQFPSAQAAANGGNLPAAQVLPATMDLLKDFYSQVAPGVPSLTLQQLTKFDSTGPTSQLPKCGGTALSLKQVKSRVFYCLDGNFIAFDTPLFDNIYKNIGDFGFAVLIANAYATYVQFKQNFPGVKDNTVGAVLGADCYTGGWAAAIENSGLNNGLGLPAPSLNTSLVLAPGDLDKVIEAFIAYDAARGVSQKSDFVFRRMEAFRQGFFQGFNSCGPAFAGGGGSLNNPSG